ncbi:3-methyladenine DNA glycosylase AlkC [Rhizobium sp. SG_E_25_P2]|uniref:DNA alkylation repair protein n=1 Tax=Rhizobium sp. SG_E_25_P2 TaxID=2879942 RepID=UPI002474E38E|nr:DNA alkylation repair protein [Rhizobium sp. SG_E_25_P2]MDH6267725.1 3-methyladenine DNA glycosylase AlkC [Rhizobium sp. SG_E_25_P2]
MEPLKNLFSRELVAWTAFHLQRAAPETEAAPFIETVMARLPDLELKARAQLVADALHDRLPKDPARRFPMLRAMLHPDEGEDDDRGSDAEGLRGWAIMPLTLLVGQHGLSDFDAAMALMRDMTKRLTSEFGIRYCLKDDLARGLRIMEDWVDDPNPHVRRLVSEGSRPRLPWAMQLPELIVDPSPMLPLLTRLRDDPSDYVRRSVANHLNDISKDHPRLTVDLARDWAKDAPPERLSLLKHGLRTLIKKGDPGALEIFGRNAPAVSTSPLRLSTSTVVMPSVLVFEAEIASLADQPQMLTVDYVIHFRKARGDTTPKVFKGGSLTLAPGEHRLFRRSHAFRPITTRRYYAGEHSICLRINGVDQDPACFDLTP